MRIFLLIFLSFILSCSVLAMDFEADGPLQGNISKEDDAMMKAIVKDLDIIENSIIKFTQQVKKIKRIILYISIMDSSTNVSEREREKSLSESKETIIKLNELLKKQEEIIQSLEKERQELSKGIKELPKEPLSSKITMQSMLN